MSSDAPFQFITHQRSRGESAVAVVACIQGREAFDRRTGLTHNYEGGRATLLNSIVLTPLGAPAWAGDPDEFWNRAESAETGDEAAVVRHAMVLAPVDTDEVHATALAIRLGRYALSTLDVPVTIAVHRPDEAAAEPVASCCSIHLAWPVRRLSRHGEANGSPTAHGFGQPVPARDVMKVQGALQAILNDAWLEEGFCFRPPQTSEAVTNSAVG